MIDNKRLNTKSLTVNTSNKKTALVSCSDTKHTHGYFLHEALGALNKDNLMNTNVSMPSDKQNIMYFLGLNS